MSAATAKRPHRIVIVGGGFGGLYAFRHLHRSLHHDARIKLTLISRENSFLFTPLLHEVATGGLSPDNIVEPIRKAIGCTSDGCIMTDVRCIHPTTRTIDTGIGIVPYDTLVLALGSTTDFANVPGARDHCFTLKSLSDALRIKEHLIRLFERASTCRSLTERQRLLHVVVIGGGPTGVELAAELAEFICGTFARYYASELIRDTRITLLQRAPELIPQFSPWARTSALHALIQKGIDVRCNTIVERITHAHVHIQNQPSIDTATSIWVAGVKPQPLACDTDLPRGARGRLLVDAGLRLSTFPDVFVIGDLAHASVEQSAPLPALAQVATKQAAFVAQEIQRSLKGGTQCVFSYRHRGDLLSIGRWRAIVDIPPFRFRGRIAWWLWRTLYLSKFLSWSKRLEVVVDWTIDLFGPRDISLIVTPGSLKDHQESARQKPFNS